MPEERLQELLRLLLTRNAQLQQALDSRIVIEQAKGILSARLDVPLPEAFLLLRAASRRNRMKIGEVAARVAASRDLPPEIEEALEGLPTPTEPTELRVARQRGAIRAAENEAYFRALNEQVVRDIGADHQERHGFLCECGAEDCIEALSLTAEEYERVRADGTHFVIAPGHELPEIERVIEETDRYHVIEKIGAAAAVVEESDPRA